MLGCLITSTFPVIVNGKPKNLVCGERGVRQGDPLSPFLFTLVAGSLSHLIFRAVVSGLTRGVKVGSKGVVVSHL